MTREGAISVLECMAVDLTGCMGGLSKKDPLEDVCRQRLEAINTAQSALRPVSREQVEDELGLWVYCNDCCALGPTKDDEYEARLTWNTRAAVREET